jgi:hypothetical protein
MTYSYPKRTILSWWLLPGRMRAQLDVRSGGGLPQTIWIRLLELVLPGFGGAPQPPERTC